MIELFTALIGATPVSAVWGAVGAAGVLLLGKLVPSTQEKKQNKREDFSAITNSLFKDLDFLKSEIARYKQDSENCEKQYEELNNKFVEFKRSYNELELRYNIQIRINKKLADEILSLEEEIKRHLDRNSQLIVDDRQESINRSVKDAPEG